MFVTLFYASFDPRERASWSSPTRGHNLPHVVKEGADEVELDRVRRRGLVLGVVPELSASPAAPSTLDPGDTIFFYTDGITEAMDEEGESSSATTSWSEVLAETRGTRGAEHVLREGGRRRSRSPRGRGGPVRRHHLPVPPRRGRSDLMNRGREPSVGVSSGPAVVAVPLAGCLLAAPPLR